MNLTVTPVGKVLINHISDKIFLNCAVAHLVNTVSYLHTRNFLVLNSPYSSSSFLIT